MQKSPTRSSTPRLSEVARHAVLPSGVVSTGWPAVQAKCRDLGITFRPWQPDVGRLILAKRAGGKYAATIGGTGLSIPRQVGKTFLIACIIFALCLLRPKLTVIWTAHRLRTAEETFEKMRGFARRKKIAPHILKITTGSGEGAIRFRNGSRILFGARERGFGRGFDEVDVLIFDEAQILTENALDDMIPATNQSRQPSGALMLFMGTPPKPNDPSEVFTRMRADALSGEDEDTGWVEFGADPGYVAPPPSASLVKADWEQVAKANPSFPEDTPREAILRMRKKLGPESFLREGLGIWDDRSGAAAFGAGNWQLRAYAPGEGRPADLPVGGLAVAVAYDLSHAAIGAAALDADGVVHLKPLAHAPGTSWVAKKAKELQDVHGVLVVIDGKGPGSDLVDDLEASGVRLHVADTDDVCDAFAEIYKRVTADGTVRHGSFLELDAAVGSAVPRNVGERKAWGRKTSGSDISVLEAETLAAWWAGQYQPAPPPPPQVERAPGAVSETYDLADAGF